VAAKEGKCKMQNEKCKMQKEERLRSRLFHFSICIFQFAFIAVGGGSSELATI
jgi:hypothetical protein